MKAMCSWSCIYHFTIQ